MYSEYAGIRAVLAHFASKCRIVQAASDANLNERSESERWLGDARGGANIHVAIQMPTGVSAARRIILLVPGFPVGESDSTCLPALQNYVEALGRQVPPESIDVVAFQYPFEGRTYLWRGIRVHALGGRNARPGKLLTWWRALRTVRRILAAEDANHAGVFHSFWFGECAFLGRLMARRHGWAHVVSVGGREVREKSLYMLLMRGGRYQLTAGSYHAARAVRHSLGRNVDAIVPLGLDIDRVRSLSSPHSREIDLLAVGSLIPLKRFGDVVRVAASLVEELPALRVAIVGEGPERPRLESQIEEAGLESRISLMGRLPRSAVLRLMLRSRVLLHPSEYESQGYVLLEALECGMHVVCRDTGYLPDTPRATRCSTPDEMADAVVRYLASPNSGHPTGVPGADQTASEFRKIYAIGDRYVEERHGLPPADVDGRGIAHREGAW